MDNTVPEHCTVEQVAYVSRHGSRFPDNGAYNEWVTLYNKVFCCRSVTYVSIPNRHQIKAAGQFTASGDLEFLHTWRPVLTNPAAQIAQESPTGWKEAFDMGYKLRTR